jgi:GNAT superfamily N-acetyltransferase
MAADFKHTTALGVEVTPATKADLPAMAELLGFLFAQEREFTPNPERQHRGLRRIMDNPAVGTLMAARDATRAPGRVIGMANLLFTESTFLGARAAWLEDVIVHPEWRGRRIGEALLAGVKQYAIGLGIRRIALLTDFDNERAMRLYERAGFKRSTMVPMRLMLEP